jgi:uncharacterized damage-inducible protein DinB
MATLPEPWLRGPIDGVPPLLMPAAHALVHAREDVSAVLAALTTEQLWTRPGGAASVGYHVRHLAGALDRLLTYARGETLTPAQLSALNAESDVTGLDGQTLDAEVERAIATALAQIRATSVGQLLDARPVGRKNVPSTVIGLVFHAAEHSTRHAGQAITTAKIVRAGLSWRG